jgi:hypothetical protein
MRDGRVLARRGDRWGPESKITAADIAGGRGFLVEEIKRPA